MPYYLKKSGARDVKMRRMDDTKIITFQIVSFFIRNLFAMT